MKPAVAAVPPVFYGQGAVSRWRGEVPVKIITAHRAAKNKGEENRVIGKTEQVIGLKGHQNGTDCDIDTGEKKEIKCLFK